MAKLFPKKPTSHPNNTSDRPSLFQAFLNSVHEAEEKTRKNQDKMREPFPKANFYPPSNDETENTSNNPPSKR